MSTFRPGSLTVSNAEDLNNLAQGFATLSRLKVAAPLSISRLGSIPSAISVALPPGVLLGRITSVTATIPPVYTAIKETKDADNEVVDVYPENVINQVLSPTGQSLVVGEQVFLVEISENPNWFWAIPTLSHRAYCDGGVLVWQQSTDGGTTWTTISNLGVACVPDITSGSGTGTGSTSGTPVDPCTACIPASTEPPTPGDFYGVVDTACVNGTLYVTMAYQRVTWDTTLNKIVIEAYNYEVFEEGCCACSGSGSGSGSGNPCCPADGNTMATISGAADAELNGEWELIGDGDLVSTWAVNLTNGLDDKLMTLECVAGVWRVSFTGGDDTWIITASYPLDYVDGFFVGVILNEGGSAGEEFTVSIADPCSLPDAPACCTVPAYGSSVDGTILGADASDCDGIYEFVGNIGTSTWEATVPCGTGATAGLSCSGDVWTFSISGAIPGDFLANGSVTLTWNGTAFQATYPNVGGTAGEIYVLIDPPCPLPDPPPEPGLTCVDAAELPLDTPIAIVKPSGVDNWWTFTMPAGFSFYSVSFAPNSGSTLFCTAKKDGPCPPSTTLDTIIGTPTTLTWSGAGGPFQVWVQVIDTGALDYTIEAYGTP